MEPKLKSLRPEGMKSILEVIKDIPKDSDSSESESDQSGINLKLS